MDIASQHMQGACVSTDATEVSIGAKSNHSRKQDNALWCAPQPPLACMGTVVLLGTHHLHAHRGHHPTSNTADKRVPS